MARPEAVTDEGAVRLAPLAVRTACPPRPLIRPLRGHLPPTGGKACAGFPPYHNIEPNVGPSALFSKKRLTTRPKGDILAKHSNQKGGAHHVHDRTTEQPSQAVPRGTFARPWLGLIAHSRLFLRRPSVGGTLFCVLPTGERRRSMETEVKLPDVYKRQAFPLPGGRWHGRRP